MEKIVYKTAGTMLVPGKDGTLIHKRVELDAEDPYTEENFKHAEQIALAGTLQVISDESQPQAPADTVEENPLDRLLLKDRATGMIYEVYIENGKLMKEVR